MSRKGCKVSKPGAESGKSVQSWLPTPGRPACRRHVLMVIRGVSQLARRLQVLGDGQCKWMLRTTRNSDEVRYPSDKRRSTCASARRLVRGSQDVDASGDFRSGITARSRPPASRPDGEPQAEPPTPQKVSVALKKSLSPHFMSGASRGEFHSPPRAPPSVAQEKPRRCPSTRQAGWA